MKGVTSRQDRVVSATAVAGLHALALLALFASSRVAAPPPQAALASFDVPPPPSEPVAPRPSRARATGRAAPPAPMARPVPLAAPDPIVPPVAPPPVTVAPVAGSGPEIDAGAAVAGPGTGAGGSGNGLGSGGVGTGTGGEAPAVLLRGAITERDKPRDARRARATGSATVRFTVGTNGRASGCTVVRTSGWASLDAVTCRVIEQRFRYRPARDTAGRAIAEERGWRQDWWLDPPDVSAR